MTKPNPKAGRKGAKKTVREHLEAGTYRPERHGELPKDVKQAVLGPESSPPKIRPDDLGPDGDWAWDYVCNHAVGITDADYPQMEIACRMWNEYSRIKKRIKDLDCEGDEYEPMLRRMMLCSDRLEKTFANLGMNPRDRMKMLAATNMRVANLKAAEERARREREENQMSYDAAGAIDAKPEDIAAPVGKTELDLYRPDFPEVA